MPGEKYTLLRMIPACLMMGIIFLLSHTPGSELQLPVLPYSDKICHFLAYAALAAGYLFGFSPHYRRKFPLRVMALTVLFSFIYGCLDEYHQSFIPLRSPDAADIAADTVGALCCAVFWRSFFWKKKGRRVL